MLIYHKYKVKLNSKCAIGCRAMVPPTVKNVSWLNHGIDQYQCLKKKLINHEYEYKIYTV